MCGTALHSYGGGGGGGERLGYPTKSPPRTLMLVSTSVHGSFLVKTREKHTLVSIFKITMQPAKHISFWLLYNTQRTTRNMVLDFSDRYVASDIGHCSNKYQVQPRHDILQAGSSPVVLFRLAGDSLITFIIIPNCIGINRREEKIKIINK